MIDDQALDAMLQNIADNTDVMVLCSQLPATYLEATETYDVGSKGGIVVGAPAARAGGGRRITVPAVTDGVVVEGGGMATHYALVDVTNSRIKVARQLSAPKELTEGTPWTSPAFDIAADEVIALDD